MHLRAGEQAMPRRPDPGSALRLAGNAVERFVIRSPLPVIPDKCSKAAR